MVVWIEKAVLIPLFLHLKMEAIENCDEKKGEKQC